MEEQSEIKKTNTLDTAMIFAAGLGTRFKPWTDIIRIKHGNLLTMLGPNRRNKSGRSFNRVT